MDMNFGQIVFFGLVAWILYMLTFRFEQYKAINDHMRGNVKDAAAGRRRPRCSGRRSPRRSRNRRSPCSCCF